MKAQRNYVNLTAYLGIKIRRGRVTVDAEITSVTETSYCANKVKQTKMEELYFFQVVPLKYFENGSYVRVLK